MDHGLKKMMNSKKYTLKPGKHQFAPGSPAEHDNDNLSDEEAAWYLKAYPHIVSLFVERLESCKVEKLEAKASPRQRSRKSTAGIPSES